MYLNNYQLIKLVLPFLFVASVLYFQQNITNYLQQTFPTVEQYPLNNINLKTRFYRDIENYIPKYEKSSIDFLNDQKQISWICENVLYHTANKQIKHKYQLKWRLSAVFAKYNTAIINSEIVHQGSHIKDAKIIKIKKNSVLIKTFEGLKWVYLFH